MIVIIGATGAGKSSVALAVAERIGGEILSVDSMAVYRRMDVGTAKASADERRRVVHHLLDVADASAEYSAAQYVAAADAVIAEAARRGVPLVATGGTPLYFKALFDGLFDAPASDPALREKLATEPADALHQRLTQIDPEAAGRIHRNDQRRLVRALEVYELTGRPISAMQQEWASGTRRHSGRWFGLNWEKDALNRRINRPRKGDDRRRVGRGDRRPARRPARRSAAPPARRPATASCSTTSPAD